MTFARVPRLSADTRRGIRLAGIGVLAASIAVFGAASSADATAPSPRFAPAPAGATPVQQPLGLSNTPVTVMVQMSGDPVAVADAAAATPLTSSQKKARRDSLRRQQEPVEQRVRDLGGSVLGTYQAAYNGVKIRISERRATELLSEPNVIGVHRIQTMEPDNVRGVPLIGAPQVWDGLDGFHGEGVKVAIIDTGIDYTHADFGGPGTAAAYEAAHANETAPADPALFGPGAPRVKGGVDLVGDSYNANSSSADYQPVPHPDPNPLDCAGHGSHVAGTAAGSGVLSDGSTYTGPYDANTVSGHSWKVGPGVAPKADLYAIRVFGCEGSTDVTVDAIEWAVSHDMDVINMSLGSPFGSSDDPSAVAASNAARDGVIVVASAGNSGQNPYITGSPATGTGVISVAASDPTASFPGAHVALSTGTTVDAIDANGAALPTGSLPVKVLMSGGSMSLGCDPQEYLDADVAGKLVVVKRGTCARVARAIYGQKAGAAAVLMVNSTNDYPPFEGPITSNPDTGEAYDVTIPFLGARSSTAAAFLAADGGTANLSAFTIDNPGYLAPASFTSGGPRNGDSWLKPDVTAPGVSIASAAVGTGDGFTVMSGTSMASPHTAGMAALVRQAHPDWRRVSNWKAAIVNTADPAKVTGYTTRVAGAGLVQAVGATRTDVVAQGDRGTATLNFGYAEVGSDYASTETVRLHNFGDRAVTFTLGTARDAGSPHAVSFSRSQVRVDAHEDAEVDVTLRVPAATAGDSAAFHDVAGLVTFTPADGGNHGVALNVPFYLVPQATSNITARLDTETLAETGTATATVRNSRGVATGEADWYAWGLSDGRDRGLGSNDVRSVGAQAWPGGLAFAIGTQNRWSNAATNEFDVFVDVNGDGKDDYDVVGVDYGLLTAGSASGLMATAVFDLRTGGGSIRFLADAPFNSSTIVLPATVGQLCAAGSPCLSAGNPRLRYHVEAFSLVDGTVDVVDGAAGFNAFAPAVSTGMYDVVAPDASVTEQVTLDSDEFALTPARGLMVVAHDNRSTGEAVLLPVEMQH
jgi:minor extracellular serine protease Vpr